MQTKACAKKEVCVCDLPLGQGDKRGRQRQGGKWRDRVTLFSAGLGLIDVAKTLHFVTLQAKLPPRLGPLAWIGRKSKKSKNALLGR